MKNQEKPIKVGFKQHGMGFLSGHIHTNNNPGKTTRATRSLQEWFQGAKTLHLTTKVTPWTWMLWFTKNNTWLTHWPKQLNMDDVVGMALRAWYFMMLALEPPPWSAKTWVFPWENQVVYHKTGTIDGVSQNKHLKYDMFLFRKNDILYKGRLDFGKLSNRR